MKILVVGDIIIDIYQYGKVDRLAPDFTGFVFDKLYDPLYQLGGAGNVALNIKALLPEAEVHLQGSIGSDKIIDHLLNNLIVHRVSNETMTKERFIAVGENKSNKPRHEQKILRVDTVKKFSKPCTEAPDIEYDYIVISDYDKGTFTPDYKFPKYGHSFIDSKKKDLSKFGFIDVLKINHYEYMNSNDSIKNNTIIVTHGHDSVIVYRKATDPIKVETYDINHTILDFCGAGDSFLAGLVYAKTLKKSLIESIKIANIVSAIAITKPRTAIVTLEDLQSEIWKAQEIGYING